MEESDFNMGAQNETPPEAIEYETVKMTELFGTNE